MSDENKESKINMEDLPQDEEELTTKEAKEVKGGLTKVGVGTLPLSNVQKEGETDSSQAGGYFKESSGFDIGT